MQRLGQPPDRSLSHANTVQLSQRVTLPLTAWIRFRCTIHIKIPQKFHNLSVEKNGLHIRTSGKVLSTKFAEK